jgi:UDP-3-O-[3-hydroxymyristoyl] N-acetylglucosamine deacetylase
MNHQKTIRAPITLSGVALHSGALVALRLLPAPVDTGIRFRRIDLEAPVEIPARVGHVTETYLATALGCDGAEVSTVEHCLAALHGLGVDNAVVEVDGPELPILDGSALPYVEAILDVGWQRQSAVRRKIRVTKPVRVANGDKFVVLRPHRGLRITYSIDFEGRFTGEQHYYLDITPETFAVELALARTFGFLEEVEYLRSVGKVRGGSLDNAVVLDGNAVLNPEGLRTADELVRHKILDAIGDLALAGHAIEGHLIVHKGGHALHTDLLRALMARPDAWELVDDTPAAERAIAVREHSEPVFAYA